jgi:hypothetical protein
MLKRPAIIYLQPIAVLATSDVRGASESLPAANFRPWIERLDPGVPGPVTEAFTSSQVLRTTFSIIPVTWEAEIAQEYQDLGEALGQMTELDEGNEWKIDASVYDAACFVAAGLMVNSYPAPSIFNHGPESVVFNWSSEGNNLYLTISADKISALISTPERIQRRIELTAADLLNPTLLLPPPQPAHLQQATLLRLNGSVPDPYDTALLTSA